MPASPNILVLMADQMQAAVLDPHSPCRTPNFDRLIARGVRVADAYTPNAICSPARASLMTGRLPHNHGVLTVNHATYDYHCDIVPGLPHFAQRLADAGYVNAYFGKWHVDRDEAPYRFGWHTDCSLHAKAYRDFAKGRLGQGAEPPPPPSPALQIAVPEGFRPQHLYGVTDEPVERRQVGIVTDLALEHLARVAQQPQPWCTFVSVTEPHDPFIAGRDAFEQYDVDALPLPANAADPMTDKPGLYRRIARVFAHLTDDQKRHAIACYFALITEIDAQFGRILAWLDASGQADNTIVLLTSDHGEFLGAHGLYMKNVGAFEEAYRVPLVVAGPGIARNQTVRARVGLQDLAATICELAGAPWDAVPDSRSAAPLLRDPHAHAADWQFGFAEYFGCRHWFSQRVIWDGPWKLVWNGFDFDELYNLDDDPHELRNRAADPACRDAYRQLMARAYDHIRATGDHALLQANYPALRIADFGPALT